MRNDVVEERLTAVRRKFEKWQIDGILISNPANRRWLSGFTGSAGQVLVTRDKATLLTDFRYWEQATIQSPDFSLVQDHRRDEDLVAFIEAAEAGRIGLEAQQVTLMEWAKLERIEGITWIPLVETVESMRAVKTAAEVEAIGAAAAITDQAMARVNELARPGMSERQLAWELEKVMREAGADGTAFTVIVASGPNSAFPHHRPGDRLLRVDEAILVDMGAQLNGYNSDLTRTFYLGNKPDAQFWQIYNLVLDAQTAALQNIKAGITGKEADDLARDVIAAAGHAPHFGHSLGHGVGLEIHEAPRLSQQRKDETLAAGVVSTVEPGVYLPGQHGVRIEDLVQVTETGVALLSQCPKVPVIPT
jgi:Xaa-Pro aminopeptidase